jgi:hypothetical protein
MLTADQMYAIGVWAVSYAFLRPVLMLQSVAIPFGMAIICLTASLGAEWLVSGSDLREIITLKHVAAATASGVGLGLGLLSLAAERAVRNALERPDGKTG